MEKKLYNYFTRDHREIECILEKAISNPLTIDASLYNEFRVRILTHIKMEEKILFLYAQKANNNLPLPLQAQLRLDHGAITSLVATPTTPEIVKVLKYILDVHDELEEKSGGMYDACESITQDQTEKILEELMQTTPVPVHQPNPLPVVFEAAKRALLRAGYDFDLLVEKLK